MQTLVRSGASTVLTKSPSNLLLQTDTSWIGLDDPEVQSKAKNINGGWKTFVITKFDAQKYESVSLEPVYALQVRIFMILIGILILNTVIKDAINWY